MDFQQTNCAGGKDLPTNMMDWFPDTAHMACDSCSDHSCQAGCSEDHCTQMCGGSSCEDASICMEEDCIEKPCESSCNSGIGQCRSATGMEGGVPAAGHQNIQQAVGGENEGSIHCPWILPGEPCDVTVETRNALGKHIYEKHIDPQLTLKCPLESCSEVVHKSNLPSHQAQQHQLDSYLCSWDDCMGPYPTSDELFNHIMSSHGYLDCHFGGCDVSLKDPLQLQNHVVEDHLDFDFTWPDNSAFDQHYSLNNEYNFQDLGGTNPPAENYPAYGNGGHHQTSYLNQVSPYGHVHDNMPEQASVPARTLREHQCHHTTVNQVQPKWHDFDSMKKPPTNQDKHAPSAHTTSPSSEAGTANTSDQETQSNGHICKWIVDTHTKSLCNQTFGTAEALQRHLRDDHCKPGKKSRLAPRIPAICRWAGCSRKGEPLTDTHKLIRHALTHSDYREHACPLCRKIFTTKASLDTHSRMVHNPTGEKPYKCDLCPKTTSNESQMAIHRRTHTGEKPYKCPVCDFRCADSTNLNKHKKVHLPNQFCCRICGNDFGTKWTLERHMRSKHKDKGFVDDGGIRVKVG